MSQRKCPPGSAPHYSGNHNGPEETTYIKQVEMIYANGWYAGGQRGGLVSVNGGDGKKLLSTLSPAAS